MDTAYGVYNFSSTYNKNFIRQYDLYYILWNGEKQRHILASFLDLSTCIADIFVTEFLCRLIRTNLNGWNSCTHKLLQRWTIAEIITFHENSGMEAFEQLLWYNMNVIAMNMMVPLANIVSMECGLSRHNKFELICIPLWLQSDSYMIYSRESCERMWLNV